MELISSDNQGLLEARGFEIAELTGFENHALPLYAHRPMGDKKPGDIILRARVGDPKSLDNGEATYLARKAFHGMFPWPPGAACMKRTFSDFVITGNHIAAGSTVEQSAPENGCKWCRNGKQRRRRTARKPAVSTK